MTLRILSGFGPVCDDINAYGGVTGFSVVASPDGVGYAIKADSTASVIGVSSYFNVTAAAYGFVAQRLLRFEGTLTAGQAIRVFSTPWNISSGDHLGLEIVQSSDGSHFKVRATEGAARTFLADGTTLLATSANHHFRIQLDAANLRVWVNGVLEITFAQTSRAFYTTRYLLRADGISSGQFIYWKMGALCDSDIEADRPDSQAAYAEGQFLDGNVAAEDEYGDDADCTTSNGDYTDCDDWATGAANDADFVCKGGTSAKKQMFTTTSPLHPPETVAGVIVRGRGRANLISKTVDTYMRIRDSAGNSAEFQNANLALDAWGLHTGNFSVAPDGQPWTPARLADLQIGVRGPGTNGASDQWSAFMVEVLSFRLDPPSANYLTARVGEFEGTKAYVRYEESTKLIVALIADNPAPVSLLFGARNPVTGESIEFTALPQQYSEREVPGSQSLVYNTTTRPTEFYTKRPA